MRGISEQFTNREFEELKDVKGDRRWRIAILEQFGVAPESTTPRQETDN